MSKDIDLKKLNTISRSSLAVAQRYGGFIFIMLVLIAYGFLILRISTLSQQEPSDDQVAEQMSSVKRLKIDQTSIDKIQDLQDQNVGVQSLFKDARENPFTD